MIAANEIKVNNRFIRELHNSRGLEYDHDFVLTEEWMGKLFSNDISIALQDLHPISLSPSILEACGFEKIQDGTMAYPEIWRIGYRSGLVWTYFDIESINEGEYTWIEGNTIVHNYSLHEIQNLFYALSRTELEYKP